MKPASVKSRILGRLVSVLLVPVILSSSITTVYVSADDEVDVVEIDAVLDAQVDEQIDDTQDTTIEDVNDDSDDSAANDVVAGGDEVVADAPSDDATETTSDGGAIEITEDADDQDGTEPLESDLVVDPDATEDGLLEVSMVRGARRAQPSIEQVSVTLDVQGDSAEVLSVKNGDNTIAEGTQDIDVSIDDNGNRFVEFTCSVSDDSYYVSEAYLIVNDERQQGLKYYFEDELTPLALHVEVELRDKTAPTISAFTSKPSITTAYAGGDYTIYYSKTAGDLKLSVTAKDEGENATGIASVSVICGNESFPMEREGETDVYSWTPSATGNYVVTGFSVKDNAGNEKTTEEFEEFGICLYSFEEDCNAIKVTNTNTDWTNAPQELVVSGYTNAEVKKITLSGNGETNEVEVTSGNSLNETIAFPKLEGDYKYSVTVEFKTGETYTLPAEYELMYDNTAPDSNLFKGTVKRNGNGRLANFTGEITIPTYVEGEESWIEQAEVAVAVKVEKIVIKRLWFIQWSERETEIIPQQYTIDVKGNTNSGVKIETNNAEYNISFPLTYTNRDNSERVISATYSITNIKVTDHAGNSSAKTIADNGSSRDIVAPYVFYYVNDNMLEGYITNESQQSMQFYKENPTIQVLLVDLAIKPESVSFEDYGEYDKECSVANLLDTATIEKYPVDGEYAGEIYYTFRPTVDGIYSFRTKATDIVNNKADIVIPQKVVVDKVAPEVTVTYNGSAEAAKYYNANTTVRVAVTERWLDTNTSYVRIVGTDEDGNAVAFSTEDGTLTWEGSDSDNYVEWTNAVDGTYHVEYYAIDRATNETEHVTGPDFTVDTKVPEIEVKYNEVEPKNGKYYNATRIATITVTDFTFDPAASDVKISSEYGNAHKSEWSNDGTKVHVMTVTFDEDGYYSFSVVAKDMVDHTTTRDEAEFVVDKTAPGISVSYDYNEPRNGMYYKTARTATVDIEDISFNSDLVKVSSQSLAEQAELPQLGGFTSDGKSNYAHMSFAYDGTYGYVINCEDLAGNTASAYTSDVFVIDTTAPEVKFAGVENYSANNGVVAPSVSYVDKYMDMEATTVTMTGSNNGAVAVGSQVAPAENGFVVSYADFEHVKSMDDLYVLEANVVDLAGNETKEQLVFSVNRFGSVFVLSDAAKVLNEEYYTSNPTDVAITEINVDELTYRNVSISRDGDIKELKNGKQYKVTKQGSDTTWKTYTYTISKDNFEKDGIYSVTVYSKDRATNVQDNKSRDAEINFAVDRTAPSIVTAGLDEAGVYKETSHVVNIDVTDNMGVTSLTVYKDDQEIESYDAEALESAGGVESITLDESEKRQTIKFVAEDVAGNVETVVYSNVLVSTKEEQKAETVEEEKTEDEGTDPEVLGATRPVNVAVYIVLALGIVAAGAGAGYAVYRKKGTSSEK
ncbi:MAG: hypothetical protein J6O49_06450 [Bacteroidaceae bacterium]|nr:hypothetical protein [Bacteroidaceae bacterium]